MRKLFVLAAAAALALVSCNVEQEVDAPVVPAGKTVVFSAELTHTRTALGDKNGSAYPVLWSAGDIVSVNGIASSPIDNSFAGTANAEFTVEGVSAPYYAAVPSSAFFDYSSGFATVNLPAEQTWAEGSYDPAAYLLIGKSSTESIAFNPSVALFSLTPVENNGLKFKSVKLQALDSNIQLAGEFVTDFETMSPGQTGTDYVTVTSADGVPGGKPFILAFMPADFSTEGFRIVITDENGGTMTRTAKPNKAYEAGKIYSSSINYVADAAAAMTITAEGITSSTAIICWNESPDAAYTVSVYSDADCSSLLDSYAVSAGNTCWGGAAPRFCISGLAPGTTYYVKVVDPDNAKESNVLSVTTEAFNIVEVSSTDAAVGDVILAEDFGELRWDSELINGGVGYFPTSQDLFSNSEAGQFLPVDTNTEKVLGGQSAALASSRLAHWAQGANNNLYIHPGYVKIVGSKKVTHIVTPALNSIPDGKVATLEIEVTASPYFSGSSASFCTTDAVVAVQTGALNELVDETKTNTLDFTNKYDISLDEATAWKTYTATLTGVVKGNRIAFGADDDISGNDARMNISDIKIKITALDDPAPATVTASLKAVSSSTAAFTWTYGGDAADDIAKPYKASLYSDAACSNLVVSHSFDADASCWGGKSPCFSFGGLAPSTTYWLVVEDTADSVTSDPVSATTEAFTPVDATTVSNAAVGDVILAEDFSEIGWGPDEFAVAAGFVPSPKNLAVPSGVSPAGIFTDYNNTGNRIFGAGVDLGSSRLSKGWGFFGNSAVYLRNAYLRIATTSSGARTHLVTPALSGIPAGKLATIEVTVTATKHESNENDVAVFVEKGLTMNGTTDTNSGSYKKYTGASLSDGQALGITTVKNWATKSVTVSNVDSSCQLAIGSYENIDTKNRFSISDVKVTIVSLADDPVLKIKDEATFLAFVSEVAGGNKTVDAEFKADVVISSSAAEAFSSIEDYEGTLNGNNYTVSGLTKPLFNELIGTVKDLTVNSTLNITADQADIGILANIVSGTVDGCTSKGSVTFNVAGGVTGEHRIGGLIGQAKSGSTVTDCTNEASVTNETAYASGNGGELIIGGVLGTFWGAQFSISACTNTGAVINNGTWNKDVSLGGIIGQAGNGSSSTSNLTVEGCTNSGAITNNADNDGSTNNVGGIVAYIRFGTYTGNSNSGDISNTGDASQNRVGGLIGYLDKKATFDDNSNDGTVSNTGEATDINYVGGLIGRMQTDNIFKDNSNSGDIANSGDAINYVYIGGIVGYLDKNNVISDAGGDAKYKLTNSGNIENSGSAKNICIGGLFGRNSSGYFNMTGTSSKYSTNSGNITDNSGPAKSAGGDLCIGGIAGYTTTGIKTQYARNSGDIYVTGDKGSTNINLGGIGGWISNASFNFNNCRNTGDVTVDCTTTASMWVAGIVGCPKPNSTKHYYWYSKATIDTHAATVGGENYTAGLIGTPSGSDDNSFIMIGHKLAGTVWGSKTTTGLFWCTKANTWSISIQKGDETHPCTIAPGTVRKDNVNDNTVNDISDVTIDILVGGAGSTADLTSVISNNHLVVQDW